MKSETRFTAVVLVLSVLLSVMLLLTFNIFHERKALDWKEPIIVDGLFGDWDAVDDVYDDPAGDGGAGNDFLGIALANDDQYLLLEFQLSEDVNLQTDSGVILYIDLDNNPDTGQLTANMGADFMYDFGNRKGKVFVGEESIKISHANVGLVTLPTVTSNVFEVAISLARISAEYDLNIGEAVRVMLVDGTDDGDILPDDGFGIQYALEDISLEDLPPIAIEKDQEDYIRVLTFNVLRDGIVYKDREEYFHRILTVLQPDILGFQEIYVFSAKKVLEKIEAWLPLPDGQQWYAVKNGNMVTVSRFPFVDDWAESYRPLAGSMPVMVQVNAAQRLLVFNGHLRCCDANDERQMQADSFAAFVGDGISAGGNVDLAPGTPFILLGDLNLVGDHRQLDTLVTGVIIDTERFGQGAPLDWDGSHLTDLISRHTHAPMAYTWFSPESAFAPGRLDFVIYSDSVLRAAKSFIFDTSTLPEDELEKYGLVLDDSANASDHLPLVVDFELLEP